MFGTLIRTRSVIDYRFATGSGDQGEQNVDIHPLSQSPYGTVSHAYIGQLWMKGINASPVRAVDGTRTRKGQTVHGVPMTIEAHGTSGPNAVGAVASSCGRSNSNRAQLRAPDPKLRPASVLDKHQGVGKPVEAFGKACGHEALIP
jgi:hypothetical protein